MLILPIIQFYTESDTVVEIILTTKIRTMGKVRDYPRPVKLVIDTENTTAIEGVHYEMNPEDAVIPAGESSVSFPVRFFRTSDLGDRKIQLMLKLEDNEYFKVYFNEQKNTNVYYATGEQLWQTVIIFELVKSTRDHCIGIVQKIISDRGR